MLQRHSNKTTNMIVPGYGDGLDGTRDRLLTGTLNPKKF